MTHFRIGVSDYPYDRDRYRSAYRVVELRVGMIAPPTNKVLRRWAKDAGTELEHVWGVWHGFTHLASEVQGRRSVVLAEGERPEHLGHFVDSPANRRVWGEVLAAAEAIEANVLLLETPASFAPSPRNKERLRAFATDWSALREGQKVAWSPGGFWTREECLELCDELGFLLVIDPLVDSEEPLPAGPQVYFRMLGAHGLGGEYSDDALELLAELCADYQDAYVIFRTDDALRDARRFSKLLSDAQDGDARVGQDEADDEDDEDFDGDEDDEDLDDEDLDDDDDEER